MMFRDTFVIVFAGFVLICIFVFASEVRDSLHKNRVTFYDQLERLQGRLDADGGTVSRKELKAVYRTFDQKSLFATNGQTQVKDLVNDFKDVTVDLVQGITETNKTIRDELKQMRESMDALKKFDMAEFMGGVSLHCDGILPGWSVNQTVLVTAVNKKMPEWDDIRRNKAEYARKWGLAYCDVYGGDFDAKRPVLFLRIKLVLYLLPMFKWVVWMDSDTLIMRYDIDFNSVFIRPYEKLSGIFSGDVHATINTCLFALRDTEWTREYLDHIYNDYPHTFTHMYGENQATIEHFEKPEYKSQIANYPSHGTDAIILPYNVWQTMVCFPNASPNAWLYHWSAGGPQRYIQMQKFLHQFFKDKETPKEVRCWV